MTLRPTPSQRGRAQRSNFFDLASVAPAALATLIGVSTSAHADDSALPTPPAINVLKSAAGQAQGLIFVAPKSAIATTAAQGPEIIDNKGRPVWFTPVAQGEQATDFRVQHYHNDSVLTWWQGVGGTGRGVGVGHIVDRKYKPVAIVHAGNGLDADVHEFRITQNDTALITIYHDVAYDLSPFGGSAQAKVVDGIVQELDIKTGKVLFEWHSLDHVKVTESQSPVPTAANALYDYFHVNAAHIDPQGHVIIDARNTWTVYTVDHKTGDVLSRLGGKNTNYHLGTDVQFAWQHDPEDAGPDTVRIFDNEAAPVVRPHSRVIWVHKDNAHQTADLVRSIEHPDGLSAGSQGNSQGLENDHTFVGWGATGRFSEFDKNGSLLFDANTPANYDTYRAYRFPWRARPDTQPVATAKRNSNGTITIHALWNGATDVDRWYVIGDAKDKDHGNDKGRDKGLWPLGSAPWNGLDTTLSVNSTASHVAVVAYDADDHEIARSASVAVTN